MITGSSSGLGDALMRNLCRKYLIYAGYRTRKPDFSHPNVLPVFLDVTDRSAIDRLRETIEKEHGKLDILINNAGRMVFGFLEETLPEDDRGVMEVNFFAPLFMIRSFLPLLKHSASGKILNISSMAGVMAMPGLGIYSASKWALEGLSESLSFECEKVQVTLVEPGPFKSPLLAENLRVRMDPKGKDYEKRKKMLNALQSMPDVFSEDLSCIVEKIACLIERKRTPLRAGISHFYFFKRCLKRFLPFRVYQKIILFFIHLQTKKK